MKMQISVRTRMPFADLRSAEAAFVKGTARLVFEAHPDSSRVLERAANVAEEFSLDIYVNGRLTDPYEIRDKLEREEGDGFKRGRKRTNLQEGSEKDVSSK